MIHRNIHRKYAVLSSRYVEACEAIFRCMLRSWEANFVNAGNGHSPGFVNWAFPAYQERDADFITFGLNYNQDHGKEPGKCTQRVVRAFCAVHAVEKRCDFRVYRNKIRYHRKLRQDKWETYAFESK